MATLKKLYDNLDQKRIEIKSFSKRLASQGKQLRSLLSYANPYAESLPIQPITSYPKDLVAQDYSPYEIYFGDDNPAYDTAGVTEAIHRDTAPIPAPDNREGYFAGNDLGYWIFGYAEYTRIAALAAKYGVTGGHYFDFGGSSGRLFRQFHYQSEDWTVWSCDFKRSSVDWNLANFPSAIRAFQGMYFPVLPVEDHQFDLVTAMSVFTHIDETETSWLMELRRITRPGGILLLTVHNEDHWLNMPEVLRQVIEAHDPEFAANETLPEGRYVSTFRDDDPYRCNTFHSNSYIHKQWGRFFEVLDIIPSFSGEQSAVILRRTA